MPYPLISDYIESIKSAEDSFKELTNLRPVLDEEGNPVMSSGNFAVVFKMMDERDGKLYAVKCFTKEQEGRSEAYRQITEELKDVDSPYLTSVRYLDKELFVDTKQTKETEFPVLLMDWVEGKTLDKYLRENLDDKYSLEMLAYRFSQLAQWLIPQPFAHGDLKPDNILVREDGTLVLVDYDGMYVPAMKGQKARELGSPDFRHPLRTEDDFDEHIDDFPLVSILLSIKALSINSKLSSNIINDGTLFHEADLRDLSNSIANRHVIELISNTEIAHLYSVFLVVLAEKRIDYRLFVLLFDNNDQVSFYRIIKNQSRGNKTSKFCLSCCLLNGIGCEKDTRRGISYLLQLAEGGEYQAQRRLGWCYNYGKGVPQCYEKAVEWYTKAAEQGDPCSQFNLGLCYAKGYGVPQSYEKAVEWYIKAAEQYEPHAQRWLGSCYANGHGVSQDFTKAVAWYMKAAEQGESNAQYSLGVCYEGGYGFTQSDEDAVKWYTISANQGHPQAQLKLGVCFFIGKGVEKNYKKAVHWFKESAKQGNAKAQYNLGCCYSNGHGVSQDYGIAIQWYSKSAEQGNAKAQYNLGCCYEIGYGTMANRDKARYWYEKAAEKGEQSAIIALGRFNTND
jgi:TPR repeat protein